jgi:predicted DNA-binding transcriptional regulator AlpA
MVPAQNLVGTHEIAERLGFARGQLVHDWRKRYDDFPEPVARLQAGLVWDYADIERWLATTRRRAGAVQIPAE